MQKQGVIIPVIFLFVLLSTVTCYAVANPIPTPLIHIDSPSNNQIYPAGTVDLHFTVQPASYINFTSFSYKIDDQISKPTNGTTTISNLPAGSHTLTIYGRGIGPGDGTYWENRDLLIGIVYFSTEYSTAWVTVTAITLAIAIIIPSSLFFKRRQIKARLQGEKSGVFWFGMVLLVLSALVFVPVSWQVANDYLFPYWPKGLTIYLLPYWLTATVCMAFMGLGFGLMWWGTQRNQT